MRPFRPFRHRWPDLNSGQRAFAVITSCLVKALDDIDDRIGECFRTRLKETFEMLLNSGTSDARQVRMLEMMSWVDELSGGNGYKDNPSERFMGRGD